MPGSAVLGSNLVDSLVPVVDELREDLHTEFGVRQFRFWTVSRVWASGVVGEGDDYTDTETEITPAPLVEPYKTRYDLQPCGVDEAGYVIVREISLSYTEAEIQGDQAALADGDTEWLIKITDAHGQLIDDQYWQIEERPFPDRIKDIGWVVRLIRTSGVGA